MGCHQDRGDFADVRPVVLADRTLEGEQVGEVRLEGIGGAAS
jgi:hypothetical protein